jgi:hypothetical protein
LTITGQPAARALAVSPPSTENAKGKLLAANTATGPSGTSMRRRSGMGGVAVGVSWSIVTSRKAPSRTTPANSRSWALVRASSPVSRCVPRWVSVSASATNSSAFASRASASASSQLARVS